MSQQRKRWPDTVSDVVKQTMLQLDLFSSRATNTQLTARFDMLIAALPPYINMEGWNPYTHGQDLRK